MGELTQPQPLPSLATVHPTGLQTQFSNPLYLRGRALRQHLVTSHFGWTFGKVQPKPRLTPGSRNKQKVNKKGKRKSPDKYICPCCGHQRGLLGREKSHCLKTATASAHFNQKAWGLREAGLAPGLTPLPRTPCWHKHESMGSGGEKEALKELPALLEGALWKLIKTKLLGADHQFCRLLYSSSSSSWPAASGHELQQG